MRILMASVEDVSQIRSWSGTPYHMYRALRAAGADVVLASPLEERFSLALRAVQVARNAAGRTYYSRLREPVLIAGYARQIRRAIDRSAPDVVLAPSTLPVAGLETELPIVTWTDATFAGLEDFYPAYSNLSARYRRLGHQMERQALTRVSLAVYSSAWAARSAVDDYGVPAENVAVVPFGANIADPGVTAHGGANGVCRLLTVGKGWFRKGVDLAVETARVLRQRGVPTTLDVVGSSRPAGVEVPDYVTVHGTLDKDDERQARAMDSLYRAATFFVLPSRADCTPVVVAEAQAYGVPIVTTDVGGVPSMIRPGASGFAIALPDFASTAAAGIVDALTAPGRYAELRQEARRTYDDTLNWPRAGGSMVSLLRAGVVGRSA